MAPLAIGSVHEDVIAVESLAAVALLALTLLPGHRGSGWGRAYTVPWAALALALALVLTILQLVPLPAGLLPSIPPGREGLVPASLDPPATVLQALRLAGILALAIASGIVVRREGLSAVRRVLWAVAAAGAVSVCLSMLGFALDVPDILGFYTPVQAGGRLAILVGTFVNPLHQGTFLGMAATAGLALAMDPKVMRWRALSAGLTVTCVVGLALVLDVVAWAASGLGALVLLGAMGAVRRRAGASAAPHLAAAVATLLVVATASIAVSSGAVGLPHAAGASPGGAQWSRSAALQAATSMALDFPVIGAGRGALAALFPAYNIEAPDVAFDHVPSVPVEALAEWGLLGGGLVLLLTGIAIALAALKAMRSLAPAGAVGALAVAGVASLFDFGLETNGVAIPAAALLGCVAGGVEESAGGRSSVRTIGGLAFRRLVLFAGTVVLLALSVVLAARPAGPSLPRDLANLRAAEGEGRLSIQAIAEVARRHPGSYLPPLAAGTLLAVERRHDEALVWLERARGLNPRGSDVALVRLRVLLAAGRWDLARAAFREVREAGRVPLEKAVASILSDPAARESVPMLVPDERPDPEEVRGLARHLSSVGRVDLAGRVFARAAAADPSEPAYQAWLGRALLEAGDVDGAERMATKVLAVFPRSPAAYDLNGMVLRARGMHLEAAHMHLEAADLVPADPEPLFRAVEALVEGGTTLGAEPALARLSVLCTPVECRRRVAVLRSRVHELDGMPVAAIAAMEEAERLMPGDADSLLRIADLHARAGDPGGEAVALRRLLARFPADSRALDRLNRLPPAGAGRPTGQAASPADAPRRTVW